MKRLLYIFFAVTFSLSYSYFLHFHLIDGDFLLLEASYLRALAAGALLATLLRFTPHSHLLSTGCILIATWPAIAQSARHTYFSLHQEYLSQHKLTELSESSPSLPNAWVLNGDNDKDTATAPPLTLPLNLATQSPTTSVKITLARPTQPTLATVLLSPLNASLKRSFKITVNAEYLRTSEYLTLFTYGRLTVQIVNNGYLITVPNLTGADVEAVFITDLPSQPSINTWIIQVTSHHLTMLLNTSRIYSTTLSYISDHIIVGDNAASADHGGLVKAHDIRLACSFLFYPNL